MAEISRAEMGISEIGAFEIGPAEVDIIEVKASQRDAGCKQVNPCLAEVEVLVKQGAVVIESRCQNRAVELRSSEIGTAKVGLGKIGTV